MKRKSEFIVILSILVIIVLLPIKVFALENRVNGINLLSKDETVKIEELIGNYMNKGNIPGLSITIVKDNNTVYEKGFGYSDLKAQKPVDSKTLFEIGSNSKAFTALGILTLQQNGQINLEDEAAKYIPWLKIKYNGKEVSITIEQLLHHTSGIPFKTIDTIPVSDRECAIEDTVKTLIGTELDSKPGERFQYTTINYDILGLIIEKVTGQAYEKYIEEKVIKPRGLNNTYLYKNEAVNKDMAKGYILGVFKPRLYDAPVYRGNKPAGYIISSGEDMAEWLKIQMNLSSNSKFNNDIIMSSHEANKRVEPLGDGSSYAAGWFIYQKGGGEISHGGNNPNYSSFIIFRPEEKIGVAVLSNLNSQYTQSICLGVNEILKGETYNKEIKDLNKSADLISVLIIFICGLIIASTILFFIRAIREIVKKERAFNGKGIKSIVKIAVSFLFMLCVTYCIYLIPYTLYGGVSWGFVFVWLPKTVKFALYIAYISIWLIYLYSIFSSLYKKEDDKSLLILLFLSVASGFGNSLIIFTINMSINSSNTMKFKLLIYFALGIILYVYGQMIMRVMLIEITNGIVYSKRMDIVKYLLRAPYNKFENIEKDRIQSTLNNDTETISRFVNIFVSGVTSAITLLFCFLYLGSINKYALILSIIIIVFIAGIYYLVGRYANRIGEESRDLENLFFKFINDLTGGFKELSLNYKKRVQFEADMEEVCDKYRIKSGQSALAFANMFVIGELLFTLAIGAIALIFPLILNNLKSTSIASYVFILLYMTGPVHGILSTIPNAIEAKISLKRINSLINEIAESSDERIRYECVDNEREIKLKLNEVEYIYDKNDERSFKVGPISFEFNSGEITFITGGNGSGKSTLAKLITGLYNPFNGNITLNDRVVSQKMLSEYYSTIFGDFYLFDKLYGIDYKSNEQEIERYLKILQLDKKVHIENGKFSSTKLSTGQKKRLALLVTYLEDKPIYMFDEWAADQDPEFRKFFYKTLLPELKERGKCVIAITHDDYYFKLADKLIKMEMGQII